MNKPTIYTVAHPEDLSPPLKNQGFCVDVVLASDYAALEQEISALDAINRQLNEKVLALVAENWNLRDVLRQLINGRPGGTYFIKWEKLCLKALNETPATDAAIAEIRNEISSPLVGALTTIANSEKINGDSFVCDFDTLVSVAAGALRNHYAQQLRAEASK